VVEKDATARFDVFYDFAFHRIYRYAQRRMDDEAQAQSLCRLVLIRALDSLGDLESIENRILRDEAEFAYWLYSLARRSADQLCAQLAEHPELLVDSECERDLEHETLEMLQALRSTAGGSRVESKLARASQTSQTSRVATKK